MTFRARRDAKIRPALEGEFPLLYRALSPTILRFFARRVFEPEAAVDLTAETFAQALVSRRKFRGATEGELEAWIWAIARAELSHYLRRGKAERRALARLGMQVPILTEEDHARIEELASLGELRVTVADALEDLDGDQREALRLRVVEERPYSAIAATLGVSEATVRARVSRGLRALARSLDQTLTAEEPVR